MAAETIMMFLNGGWGYCAAYRETHRCWFVTEFLEAFAPRQFGNWLKERLETFEFERIGGCDSLYIDYKSGFFEIYYKEADDFDDPVNYTHITPKLLHALITRWLEIIMEGPHYILINIDWENERVTMQTIKTWDGPLNAIGLSCPLPPRAIGKKAA